MNELIDDIKDTAKTFWYITVYASSSGSKSAIKASRNLAEDMQSMLNDYMAETDADAEEDILEDCEYFRWKEILRAQRENLRPKAQ